ncbi:glycosyltransferase involved in cell wall biosynthesis [Bradyrhizobium sp. JR1.5]|uniref:glycosyltransferase n=1 Tax=unclassified Bradyrhizobium TaxID=2631580 RepID=UPI0033976E55
MKFTIWHNILWSRYKAVVFSAVNNVAQARGIHVNFYQIAETERNRVGLSPVDRSWHQYPFKLLFPGAYSDLPKLSLFWSLAREAWNDDSNVTILCGYERPEIWLQAMILKLRGKQFALFCDSTLYDHEQTFFKGVAKRIIFNLADGIFCYGIRAVEYVGYYGVPSTRSFVRCQAAALPKTYLAEEAFKQRLEKAPRSSEPPRFLYVGRFSPEKSLEHLVQAFKQVLASWPGAKLVLVGKGPSEQGLRAIVSDLGINDDVIFTGAKYDSDLFEEYSKATCFVLPSHSEPWGLVVNEALSYACPVIVSYRCGCVPELVAEGKTGFSFEWGNLQELVDRMNVAPTAFSDVTMTARACLHQIQSFTPENAAKAILDGCAILHSQR